MEFTKGTKKDLKPYWNAHWRKVKRENSMNLIISQLKKEMI